MTATADGRRILGIDPGLNTTGYGVVTFHASRELELVEAGVIRGGAARLPLGERLAALRDGIGEVLEQLQPDVVAVENLYSHYDRPSTAILMGHARGVFFLAAADAGLNVRGYSATQVKKTLTGNGHATKSQMQMAVARLLDLDCLPEPADVADALAVAVCHCFAFRTEDTPA